MRKENPEYYCDYCKKKIAEIVLCCNNSQIKLFEKRISNEANSDPQTIQIGKVYHYCDMWCFLGKLKGTLIEGKILGYKNKKGALSITDSQGGELSLKKK